MPQFVIPRCPESNNKLLRMHHFVRGQYNKQWYQEIELVCRPKPKKPFKKASVRYIMFRWKAIQDPDNAIASTKPLTDGLHKAGWISNDTRRELGSGAVVEEIKVKKLSEAKTVIEIEEIP